MILVMSEEEEAQGSLGQWNSCSSTGLRVGTSNIQTMVRPGKAANVIQDSIS